MAFQYGNIDVKSFQNIFQQLGQIRLSYYLDIGNYFYTHKSEAQKPNLVKSFFGTLKFKSVNSISSSFAKTLKHLV